MCGVDIRFGISKSFLLVGGSASKTSIAAPAILPVLRDLNKASSSITSPRDVLIRNADGFIIANLSELIRCFVSLVIGIWHVIKSELANKVFKSVVIIPTSLTYSPLMGKISYPNKFIRRPFASLPTFLPMLPTPIIPRYLPFNSIPISSFFIHFPSFNAESAFGMLLAKAIISPITNSPTAFKAASAALITLILFDSAYSVSMLSKPTPTLAIIFTLAAESITGLVILVLLLTTITS